MIPLEAYEAWAKTQHIEDLSSRSLAAQIAFQAGIEYQKGQGPQWHDKPTCAGKWTFGSTVIEVTEAMLSGEHKTDIFIPDSHVKCNIGRRIHQNRSTRLHVVIWHHILRVLRGRV